MGSTRLTNQCLPLFTPPPLPFTPLVVHSVSILILLTVFIHNKSFCNPQTMGSHFIFLLEIIKEGRILFKNKNEGAPGKCAASGAIDTVAPSIAVSGFDGDTLAMSARQIGQFYPVA